MRKRPDLVALKERGTWSVSTATRRGTLLVNVRKARQTGSRSVDRKRVKRRPFKREWTSPCGQREVPVEESSEVGQRETRQDARRVPGSKGAEEKLRSLGDGLFVKGSINEVPVIFTTDTGASRTIISKKVYRRIPEGSKPVLSGNTSLRGASGVPIKEIGKGLFELRLGEVSVRREAIVAEIDDEVLLGYDVLTKGAAGSAEILNNQCVIVLDGQKVGGNDDFVEVSSVRRVDVGGLSESISDVRLISSPKSLNVNDGCLNEFFKHGLCRKTGNVVPEVPENNNMSVCIRFVEEAYCEGNHVSSQQNVEGLTTSSPLVKRSCADTEHVKWIAVNHEQAFQRKTEFDRRQKQSWAEANIEKIIKNGVQRAHEKAKGHLGHAEVKNVRRCFHLRDPLASCYDC
ncbi:hypothetical protein DPMN_131697 [Dreissena polymorpha]|uniref:Peptidase A2 domain-containing protein n=1 Tax=Dreissena polymorpha TaxID=45954 RepID=A0A9D4J872_DREPO|nr:hypothetical protein DPMN_131697 [Dreissena polymorpha]